MILEVAIRYVFCFHLFNKLENILLSLSSNIFCKNSIFYFNKYLQSLVEAINCTLSL